MTFAAPRSRRRWPGCSTASTWYGRARLPSVLALHLAAPCWSSSSSSSSAPSRWSSESSTIPGCPATGPTGPCRRRGRSRLLRGRSEGGDHPGRRADMQNTRPAGLGAADKHRYLPQPASPSGFGACCARCFWESVRKTARRSPSEPRIDDAANVLPRWVAINGRITHERRGMRPVRCVARGSVRDVSERKRVERRVRQHETAAARHPGQPRRVGGGRRTRRHRGRDQ